MKQPIIIVMICVICAATMMGGCLEVDDHVNDNDAKTEIARVLSESDSQTPTSEKISVQSTVDKYMDSAKSKYDKAQFDQSYMRDSDGFELYYVIRQSEAYHSYFYGGDGRWSVNTFSTYLSYDNMEDDENHGFSVYIDHYDTIRDAHEKMVKCNETTFSCSDNHVTLETSDYSDQSYRYISPMHDDSNDVISGYSANIFILEGKTIGRLHVYRYTDMEECAEVVEYYAPFLSAMLNNID